MGWLTPKSTLKNLRQEIELLHPDIIFLQESKGNQFEFLAEEIWPHVTYGKNAVYPKGHHGNAILSKFPLISSHNTDISMGAYEHRGLLHATAALSHNKNLHLLCVHLGLLKKDRHKQLKIIVDYINHNIPQHEPLILGGDFNDWRKHATEPLINQLGLHEAFLHHHGAYAKTYPAWAPVLQLDRIYCRGFLSSSAVRLTNRKWKSLSDHIAIEVCLKIT
ncbi:MAG: endonuclease/exonuclease/phosphatase family protein [Gammaproteobacteria bacterium]|nr:endonuclease/exonuclease/phosphatase family protein [Gammaproteobacteria bacterium]